VALFWRLTDGASSGDNPRHHNRARDGGGDVMSRYFVTRADDQGFAFLNRYVPVYWSPCTFSIVNCIDDEIVAAVVLQDSNGVNAFIHVAADTRRRWLTRDYIYKTFRFAFDELGLNRLTGLVESDNELAIHFDEKLGFRKEAVLTGAGHRGQDAFIYAMHRHECRWLTELRRG
jgi:RimJ/RimL family protein N-acetyltransferase